jgi:acetolactate synthase-1/3 small subunit
MLRTHIISILVSNKPGVLVRISALFSRRAYNIESLVVSPALDGQFSRMTITAEGHCNTLEQIIKQLNKLIDVIHASEHDPQNTVIRELALIKVKVTDKSRAEVLQVVDHFGAITIDFSDRHLLVQLTAESDRIDSFIQMLDKYGLQEMVRTGKIVATKGASTT